MNRTLQFFLLFILFASCQKEPNPPAGLLIFTKSADLITYNSVVTGGSISTTNQINVIERGICWNYRPDVTYQDNYLKYGNGLGNFSFTITGLNPSTNYYIRAYAKVSDGTIFYGKELNFTTLSTNLGIVNTLSIDSITENSSIVRANISSDGGAQIFDRGICWSTQINPTTLNNSTNSGTGIGNFSATINGLKSGTTYYTRAYATNLIGTSYGANISFKTSFPSLPIITTTPISSISSNTAYCGGNITSSGGTAVIQRGVCWSSITNIPAINNFYSSNTSDGAGTGSFSSFMSGLSSNTYYYVRAYATNSAGTSYGTVYTFTTNSVISLATVLTSSISSITTTTANSGGNITTSGGASITKRGVCWSSMTSSPTITNSSSTNDGSGIGVFSSNLTGLSPNTNYYLRAYATNSAGTAYGNVYTFTTQPIVSIATITTTSVSSISSTSANSGGNVISSGGASVTKRGVCWSNTASLPTITNSSSTNDGSGTGSFSTNLSGLLPNTNYYVRAYATNSAGTAYGAVVSFTTQTGISLPTIITTSVSSITSKTANSGGNITSNGGAFITAKGVCWSNITNQPTINSSKSSDGIGSGSFSSVLSGLSQNTTYYVRAYATNSVGTAYGSYYTFITTSSPLGIPTLTYPSSGTNFGWGTLFNFQWSIVTSANNYEIELSQSITFSGNSSSLNDCSSTFLGSGLTVYSSTVSVNNFCIRIYNKGRWYWRVRAINGSNIGNWSSPKYYDVQ